MLQAEDPADAGGVVGGERTDEPDGAAAGRRDPGQRHRGFLVPLVAAWRMAVSRLRRGAGRAKRTERTGQKSGTGQKGANRTLWGCMCDPSHGGRGSKGC
ncbi:hypothetical protein AA12717_1967 [Gluconacetobacter sacchari DSM 12717]|uniref:Uncharacterized protein n=1 Tax=Gluconacetobacter sacchari DSM 12717 TaxID=1307940 RepID=A0ABQ0P792_9PROT|nr:hypothetical protein AA12717_1967 [Gluconacetobacter sacchari DSM 12717]